ncbi:MAG: hypothetical protein NT013_16855 [Planctomycetia bacterium]|nr:hypothetical protein [Planctomycetia bacterium]
MRCFHGVLVGIVTCTLSTGCALTHEAQPHRLWRFNRGPGPSSNPYFSVNDPTQPPVRRANGWTPHKPPVIELGAAADPTHEPPVADRD